MVADAHLTLLQGLHELLENLFESTVMVADEGSLLKTVEQCCPEMIIADLSFPVTSDANVVSLARNRLPATPIIVMSVHDEASAVRAAMEQGASAFVLKRTAAVDLCTAVEAVRRGETHVSPSVRFTISATKTDAGIRGPHANKKALEN